MKSINKVSLAWAHPLIQKWFDSQFSGATEPQEQGWPAILAGNNTLIAAPTGSGKTFAAFLVCIDQLVRQALIGTLKPEITVLYISPLKALTNDIQKNLLKPLGEIVALGKEQGYCLQEIAVAVRTGDTLAYERRAMLRKPPAIVVTTPESFYLLLTAEKSRALLNSVKTVIVDEIHALAPNKRGSHLALSLERLDALCLQKPIRIGLSATQRPMSRIASYLSGGNKQSTVIVDLGHRRELDLAIEVPEDELGPITSNNAWDEIYTRLAELVEQNRSTLIFVNTRRLAERIAHHLAERLGKEQVAAHHGSLSRKLRLSAETQLKQGELRALVATASLELGIDIGTVDLVCQIGSPRAIAIALQRVGRAGHWQGAIPKGRFFATTRDELLECAALIYAIQEGDLDKLEIPIAPLDILAQQIVAACASEEWYETALFTLIKQSFPYRNLSRSDFDRVLSMLAEGIAGARGRYGTYLFRDRIHGKVKARRGARLIAITSGGAIPENALFTVLAEPKGVMVGTLDEDFAIESHRGDIILLGNTSWRVRRIEAAKGRVFVEDAHGAPPTVPFWVGEAPARTNALSLRLSELRERLDQLLPQSLSPFMDIKTQPETGLAVDWLKSHCRTDDFVADQIIAYILQGRAVLGAVPTHKTLIVERFFDEGGGMQLIIHSPLGGRLNKAWGLALRKRFCRSFNFELQASATDNGIAIALAEQHSFPLADVFHFLHPSTINRVLTQATLQSPIFKIRWRWVAVLSLALVRFRHGKKVPPNILRMLADDLLAAVFPDAAACQDNLGGRDIVLPQHPLVDEAMKDCLTEAMDSQGLTELLTAIVGGKIHCIAIDTIQPSVFAHEIVNANPYAFLDDAPLEERRARAVELRRLLPESVLGEIGQLNPLAIAEVKRQSWPDVRNADELHDALQTLVAFPLNTPFAEQQESIAEWGEFFTQLLAQGRAGLASVNLKQFWLATESLHAFQAIYPDANFPHQLIPLNLQTEIKREDAILTMVRGWLQQVGPVTAEELVMALGLSNEEITAALLQLEGSGLILRGSFRSANASPGEWCERRLLARMHRLTLGRLRKAIEPVTTAHYVNWLVRWQHREPDSQVRGEQGVLEVIKQLQGYEIPANAWENKILSLRVCDYQKEVLDHLCLTGVIGWGRFSPHSALENLPREGAVPKRILPIRTTPITFFVRGEADWIPEHYWSAENLVSLSPVGKRVYAYLETQGASFFIDIVQGVGHLKTEVEVALLELVTAGLITADSFANLRVLIAPNRSFRGRRTKEYRQAMGRWSLLNRSRLVIEPNDRCEAVAWMLLKRYGVCFRELVIREKLIPRWRELLVVLRRLEDRGEIRGGRFINGFFGEQFALPYAVDSLRASKRTFVSSGPVNVYSCDPLNLLGILLPGEKIAVGSGKTLVTLPV